MGRNRVTSAMEYYVSGQQFFNAHALIISNPKFEEWYNGSVLATSENAAFCAECFLKALLIKKGFKADKITNPKTGHNIIALRDMCRESGYDLGPLLVDHVLEDLSPCHDDFRFRYFEEINRYTIRGFVETHHALQRLEKFVRETIADEPRSAGDH